ncbi:hypothetical protein SAMN05444359_113110 [Neolewinella agarilytica]|uniref:Uncharacterized protein n=1 Tax=Neolewinella agarilytica TaxID=478744 RepID=A0A1H9HUK7_9BACT|nr:hypothetical protein SAMN05444359_113110 [Neolewinella agarilytica]
MIYSQDKENYLLILLLQSTRRPYFMRFSRKTRMVVHLQSIEEKTQKK